MTIRDMIRRWLGVDQIYAEAKLLSDRCDGLLIDRDRLKADVAKLKSDLGELQRKRLSRPSVMMPEYVDYETAQVVALEVFKEK